MNADAILKRIEQDARQSAEATMDDARKRAEALSAARREKLSQEDEAAMAQARKDALALDDRLQRMAELDARKALLAEKRRVLDEAFALALEKMRKMPAARAMTFFRAAQISVMPFARSSSMARSMRGLPKSGTMGLGSSPVTAFRRRPSPPAMITAFMSILFVAYGEILL